MELKVGTFQMDIVWNDTKANIEKVRKVLDCNKIDLLVLPEMFNTGFNMESELVALDSSGFIEEIITLSSTYDVAICGSFAAREDQGFFNRMFFVYNSEVSQYDKRHLFRMAKEDESYKAGDNQVLVDFKGFKFALNVCYDLRFPVWSRRTNQFDYEALIYVANWPAVRSEAWFSLLKARSIENISYCIGVNRVGVDGNSIEYDGRSATFDFLGTRISNHIDSQEGIEIVELSKDKLLKFREKFPAHLDSDQFDLKL